MYQCIEQLTIGSFHVNSTSQPTRPTHILFKLILWLGVYMKWKTPKYFASTPIIIGGMAFRLHEGRKFEAPPVKQKIVISRQPKWLQLPKLVSWSILSCRIRIWNQNICIINRFRKNRGLPLFLDPFLPPWNPLRDLTKNGQIFYADVWLPQL